MTRNKALRHIASMMAAQCAKHRQAAKDYPALVDNSADGVKMLQDIADALDIRKQYTEAQIIHGVFGS